MLNNITIGQYFPANSVIHRADPRVKILLTVAVIVILFLASGFVALGICAAFCILLILLTKIPVKMYLKNLKAIWAVLLLTAALNVFYITGERDPLFKWKFISIYTEGIERAVFIAVRIFLLIIISSALTYTTSPTELTDAIERLLSPLKLIGLGGAVHVFAMMMSIALRFIPTLIEETDKIMSAQKARGAEMDSGNLIKRIKAMLPIMIPLLFSSVRRAYDLAEAMECRCYNGGAGKTKMKQLHLALRDFALVFGVIILLASVILLRIFSVVLF